MSSQDHAVNMASAEAIAFQAYENKYAVMFPPPEAPAAIQAGKDWKFISSLIASTASVLLSSTRTAEAFYRAASRGAATLGAQILGWIEAFLAVFTVEFSVVVYSAILSDREKGRVSPVLLWFGVILLSAMQIVAGTDQAMYFVEGIIDPKWREYTSKALTFAIGPGAAIAAVISGHVLGKQLNTVRFANQDEIDDHEHQYKLWRGRMIKAWEKSDEFKMLKGDFDVPELSVGNSKKGKSNSSPPVKSMVYQWLRANNATPFDEDLSPLNIARDLGFEDSDSIRPALTKLRREWNGKGS